MSDPLEAGDPDPGGADIYRNDEVGSGSSVRALAAVSQSTYEIAQRLTLALEAGRMGAWERDFARGASIWSDGVYRILGWEPGGGAPSLTQLLAAVHSDDRDAVRSALARTAESGADYHAEYRVTRPDGATRWVESRGRRVGGAGKSARVIGVMIDVTERRSDREAMAVATHRAQDDLAQLRAVFQGMGEAVVISDLDGNMIAMNPACLRLHGFDNLDHWRAHISEYPRTFEVRDLAGRLVAPGEWPLPRAMRGETFRDVEVRVRRLDTGLAWVGSFAGGPVLGGDGRPILCVLNIRDVTAQKRAEDSLREADRRKNQFLAMLSHELRNPLAAMSGALQLARADGSAEQAEWAAGVVDRQLRHVSKLVDDLLDVSRVDSGKIQLRRESHDLLALVDRAVESIEPSAAGRRIALSRSSCPGPVPVLADATRIVQVLVNILLNAVKYTEPGGRVELEVSREGGPAVVSVRDTGVGIAAEMLPGIFELFAQVDDSIDRAGGGLGIGLSLARTLAEMHGGTVTAASDGLGLGSTFRVVLPAGDEAAPVPQPAAAPAPSPRGRRVLVVDDNLDTARALSRFLRLAGHDARVAHDGAAAVAAAGRDLPEVVLMDLGLPGMDGYQAARALRDDPRFGRILIVAISGYGQESDRIRARESGFDRHFVKPMDYDELLKVISSHP